jgi:hypothetical protein
VAAGDRWSAFFDTTELTGKRIPSERLTATSTETGAGLYVCELAIDERAFQRLRDFVEQYDRLQGSKAKVVPYVSVDVGQRPGDPEMLERFRGEERSQLEKARFTIIPTEGIIAAEHAALQRYRDPRIKGEKGRGVPGGLNDAIILMSGMKYAQAKKLDKCLFVSNNTDDFSPKLVEGLGREYGQEWRFITDAEAAIRFLEGPDLAKAATDFMRANSGSLLRFIEQEKAKIWPDSLFLLGPPVLQDLEAFGEPPTDGAEVKLRFHATVRFTPIVIPEPPPLPLRAAAMLYYGPFQPSLIGQSLPHVRAIEGEAQVRYQKGLFVGEPSILAVRPRALEISVAN